MRATRCRPAASPFRGNKRRDCGAINYSSAVIYTWRRKTRRCSDFVTSTVYSGNLSADATESASERTAAAYLRDDIELTRGRT